ncbi:MAG: DUF4286 family protein [Chthoniobacterales bacterium]
MILYSVMVNIQSESEAEWTEWMRQVHLPEVIEAGCFEKCRMYRANESESGRASYVMQYRCASIADYERSRDEFGPALQKDHSNRFSGRFTASRQILEKVAEFQPR